jgi:pimeloyl-ACP methyl ester carboxylesterase
MHATPAPAQRVWRPRRAEPNRKTTLVTVAVLFFVSAWLLIALSGCATSQTRPMHATMLNADLSGSGPGTLDDAVTLPDVDPALRSASSLAARITYRSSSGIDDSPTQVTAAVFVPLGAPPPQGWPIVALGHPATGIQHDCAPSQSPTLLGSEGAVLSLLQAGYVVTISDYQGLGLGTTYHPFLDSSTVGVNLIDSVFAARRLVTTTSIQWIALGLGQGGEAAWAANELSDNAGRGLDLLGAVSLSPAADLTGLGDAAVTGTLTTEQKLALQWYLAALKNEYPDVNLDDYRRGVVGDKWDVLSACQRSADPERASVAEQIPADDLRPSSLPAADGLRGFLQKTNLPQGPTAAPMLVIYGDDDPLIPAAWTERALNRACKMGDTIAIETAPDTGYADPDMPAALGWMKDLAAGNAARDDCPTFGGQLNESSTAAP